MRLIDTSVIATKLRFALEQLFQLNNQATYLGCIHRSAAPLTTQMGNRLFFCIDEIGQVVQELEPRPVDVGNLTLEEDLILSGYQEIKQGLIKSWEFIQGRERVIFDQAKARQSDQGRAGR